MKAKLIELERVLGEMGQVIVAYSGGVDSGLLAAVAHNVFANTENGSGDKKRGRALIATAVSPSLASRERKHCREFAEEMGFDWVEVPAFEMDLEQYRENELDRCYWCKASLMEALANLGQEQNMAGAQIVLGVNLDDLADHRPGIDAARERGARFPFLEAEISKQDIRDIAKELGLRIWDKPAEPCLASRIPFGTKVSVEVLSQIDCAESNLKELGFERLRVRHHNDTARIEVPEADFPKVLEHRADIVSAVTAAGYKFVTLDLEGLRTGGLLPDFLTINSSNG